MKCATWVGAASARRSSTMTPSLVSSTACLSRISSGFIVDVKNGSRGGAGACGFCGRGACASSATSISSGSSANITRIICYIRFSLAVTIQAPRGALQYEEFYGFAQSPFTLAPDPRFLYPSPSHEEAIRQLLQTIKRREGVAVLSGDIGTGKTTVCRTVLEQLDMTLFTSLVLNPFLSGEELLREILLDFGVISREAVRSGRIMAASRH